MASGILCQSCGIEAPVRQIEFNQNIGALFMRFTRTYKGEMCKRCIHKHYWQTTGVNLSIGWLGTISLILAPVFFIANTVRYLSALGMPAVPTGAMVPQLTPEAINRIAPFQNELVSRLNANEPLAAVAPDLAARAGVTPGTVVKYLIAWAAQQRQQRQAAAVPQQRPTGGFPVIPVAQTLAAQTSTASAPPPLPVQPVQQPASDLGLPPA